MLEIQGLSVQFLKTQKSVIQDLSAKSEAGKWIFLMGENGVGKSTLLGALAGETHLSATGSVLLEKENILTSSVKSRAQQVLKLNSDIQTEFPIRVDEYLGLAAYASQKSPLEKSITRSKLFGEVLSGFGGRALNSLSGGETQRVLLARAEVQNPQLLLLDETFSRMDLPTLKQAANWIQSFLAQNRHVIQVSHDPMFVMQYADEVWWLDRNQKMISIGGRSEFKTFLEKQYQ